MALSMFLYNSKHLTPNLHRQMSRLALQTYRVPRSSLPASIAVQQAFPTPTIQIHNPSSGSSGSRSQRQKGLPYGRPSRINDGRQNSDVIRNLWTSYTQKTVNALRVQYNNGFRMFLGLPRFCSASGMFAQVRTDDFFAIMRKKAASLLCRVRVSSNSILRTIAVSSRANKELVHDEHPHDHARMWIIEKGCTALLMITIPAALLYPHRVLDCIMAILIVGHSYWGLEAVIVEYARTIVVGHFLPKVLMAILFGLTALQLGGLFFLAYNGFGIAHAFWEFWLGLGPKKYRTEICRPKCE